MFKRRQPKVRNGPHGKFTEAKRECEEKSRSDRPHIVSGTWDSNRQPLYFVVPADATNEEVQVAAFVARNGRPPLGLEVDLAEFIESEPMLARLRAAG